MRSDPSPEPIDKLNAVVYLLGILATILGMKKPLNRGAMPRKSIVLRVEYPLNGSEHHRIWYLNIFVS